MTSNPDPPEKSDASLRRFERLTQIPMLALAVVFLVVLVLPVLDTQLTRGLRQTLVDVETGVWVVFAAEYAIRLWLAPYKLRFVLHNILDLVVVVVPVLRPLRLARLARVARVGALSGIAGRGSSRRLHVDVAVQVVIIAAVIVFVGAVGVLDVERNAPGANIHTFPDALWWAISTVTTVGYGDRFPVTGQGELIGAAVMITGIAVLGVVSASVAGWFVDNLQTVEQEESQAIGASDRVEARLAEVLDRLGDIETLLARNQP